MFVYTLLVVNVCWQTQPVYKALSLIGWIVCNVCMVLDLIFIIKPIRHAGWYHSPVTDGVQPSAPVKLNSYLGMSVTTGYFIGRSLRKSSYRISIELHLSHSILKSMEYKLRSIELSLIN